MRRLWTSPLQAQIMLGFIEQHGNLIHIDTPRGRILSNRRWSELAEQLNSCGTGDPRPAEKWKKVWSDFKSNTRKKAVHINQVALACGGEPADEVGELTELEKRVLAIINPAAEIEMDVPKKEHEPSPLTSPQRRCHRLSASVLAVHSDRASRADTPVPHFQMIDPNIPGCSTALLSPGRQQPPPRRRLRRHWRPPTTTDRAIMLFVKAFREEREHRREIERRRELWEERERQHREEDRQFRQEAVLRQEQIQRQWMDICTRALDLLERFAPS